MLKKLFGENIERMPEADLNQESLKAASHYMAKTGSDKLGLVEQQSTLNNVAHGFYMGVRWYEEQLGAKKKEGSIL